MDRFVSHCLIKYMPYSWSDETNIVVVFFRWSLSGNMSWQDQSLWQAFFALDPSRALKEFDSAIIYLAFYFRFIKKQIELWHEGQGLICQVNEPMHLSVYCTTLSNQIQLLFQSALQKISTCSELIKAWLNVVLLMLFKVIELESGVSMLNYCCTNVSSPLFNPVLINPEQW